MPRITFIDRAGTKRGVVAVAGGTLMETAVAHGIDGIDALCGGACACGTCHIYAREPWLSCVGLPGDIEQALLESTGRRRAGSRLSCQLMISEDLDGMIVEVAPTAV
ncbi:MAG: 2Fe-2S iron-sulfur cluster-binding protein [bacterium]